ncbi:MAG: SH3 domain-containing protein [Anaerolineae bacterium]
MMARVDKQKLQREKQLFAYSSALQQGDFDTVARILQAAEHDPLLADMLAEINVVYERELPSLTPMVNHSSNHYEEKLNMTASVTVVPHRPLASSRPRLSITLLAAMLAVSLLGGIMLFMRPNTSPNIQAGAAPTASPSVTVTATLIPTASPVGANDGVVNHQIVTINTGSPDIRLTVRAEPSLSAHIVTTLPDGHIAALVAYSDDGQWARIILSDGSTGWVIRDMLSPDPNLFVPTIIPAPTIIGVVPIDPSSPLAQLTPANPVLCEGVIGNVPAFVFSRPSTSGVVVDTIQYSEVLQIGDEEYNPVTNVSWYYVGHGWVMAEAFTVLNNCPPVNLAAVSVDQADVETTQQAQLTGVPFVPTVPPPPSLIPTPTAYLNSRIGDGQFSAITLRPVGEIPSGTLVKSPLPTIREKSGFIR